VVASLATLKQLRDAGLPEEGLVKQHRRSLVLVEVQCENSSGGYRTSSERDRDGPDVYADESDCDAGEDRDSQGRDSQEDDGAYGNDTCHAAADPDTRGRGGERPAAPLMGLARVDDQVRRLYEAAAPGTLLLVVTQGSMVAMKLLASQKMR
jgi:hypothetical protein